jgi:hypothetical protein
MWSIFEPIPYIFEGVGPGSFDEQILVLVGLDRSVVNTISSCSLSCCGVS